MNKRAEGAVNFDQRVEDFPSGAVIMACVVIADDFLGLEDGINDILSFNVENQGYFQPHGSPAVDTSVPEGHGNKIYQVMVMKKW